MTHVHRAETCRNMFFRSGNTSVTNSVTLFGGLRRPGLAKAAACINFNNYSSASASRDVKLTFVHGRQDALSVPQRQSSGILFLLR